MLPSRYGWFIALLRLSIQLIDAFFSDFTGPLPNAFSILKNLKLLSLRQNEMTGLTCQHIHCFLLAENRASALSSTFIREHAFDLPHHIVVSNAQLHQLTIAKILYPRRTL